MSKTVQMFIRLCDMFTYMLDEVLPELEASESVKVAIKQVVTAILKYSYKINYKPFSADECVLFDQESNNYSCRVVSGDSSTKPGAVNKQTDSPLSRMPCNYGPPKVTFSTKDRKTEVMSPEGELLLSSSNKKMNTFESNASKPHVLKKTEKESFDKVIGMQEINFHLRHLASLNSSSKRLTSTQMNHELKQVLTVTQKTQDISKGILSDKATTKECQPLQNKTTQKNQSVAAFPHRENLTASSISNSTNSVLHPQTLKVRQSSVPHEPRNKSISQKAMNRSASDEPRIRINSENNSSLPSSKDRSSSVSVEDSTSLVKDKDRNSPVTAGDGGSSVTDGDRNSSVTVCHRNSLVTKEDRNRSVTVEDRKVSVSSEGCDSSITSEERVSSDRSQDCKTSTFNSNKSFEKNAEDLTNVTSEINVTYSLNGSTDVSDNAFEQNFLQFYSFDDNGSSEESLEENSVESSSDSGGKGSTISKKSLQYFQSQGYLESSLLLGFEDINLCFQAKLIKKASFCFICHIAVDSATDLYNHLQRWGSHGALWKEEQVGVFDLCTVCSFTALAPLSKKNDLISHHGKFHVISSDVPISPSNTPSRIISSTSLNHLIGPVNIVSDVSFVDGLLRQKHIREKILGSLPTFLSICLICKTSFSNPIEWNHHIFEYQHLIVPSQTLITCNACCLVLLGYFNQNLNKLLLNSKEHVKHSKPESSPGRFQGKPRH